jgi:hypothetical protein
LNEKFVCFAPGWFINVDDAVYQAAWKRFYIGKPLPTEGNGWLQGTQLVLMTSTGRLLSGAVRYGDRNGLGPALEQVLEAYKKLPQDERLAARVDSQEKPVPAPPEGGVVLTIYDRPLGCAEGKCRLPTENDLDGLRTSAPAGQRSSLWLTAAECQSLIPQEPKQGESYPVDQKLAKRIFLYGLWPQTLWVVEHTWQADSLRDAELNITVADVSPRTVSLRVHGSVVLSAPSRLRIYPTGEFAKDLENRYDARVEGILVYERASEKTQAKIVQWDMVALGDYRGAMFTSHEKDGQRVGDDQWREATAEAPVPLAFAFELDASAYENTPERRRPRSFVHSYIFRDREQFYWDPEKWEADWKARMQP